MYLFLLFKAPKSKKKRPYFHYLELLHYYSWEWHCRDNTLQILIKKQHCKVKKRGICLTTNSIKDMRWRDLNGERMGTTVSGWLVSHKRTFAQKMQKLCHASVTKWSIKWKAGWEKLAKQHSKDWQQTAWIKVIVDDFRGRSPLPVS